MYYADVLYYSTCCHHRGKTQLLILQYTILMHMGAIGQNTRALQSVHTPSLVDSLRLEKIDARVEYTTGH